MALVLLLASLSSLTDSQTINCTQYQPCRDQTIHCNAINDCIINCNGAQSCSSTTIILQPSSNLILQCGSQQYTTSPSCYKLNITNTDPSQNTLSTAKILCTSSGCSYSSFDISNLYNIQFICNSKNSRSACSFAKINIINTNDSAINCFSQNQLECNNMEVDISNTKTVNMLCNASYPSSSTLCQSTTININNMLCNSSTSCQSTDVNVLCDYPSSCRYMQINGNIIKTNINMTCNSACSGAKLNANHTGSKINLKCNGGAACISMELSCYRYTVHSCNIISNSDYYSYDINVATVYNDYVEDFVYVSGTNQGTVLYVKCYNPYAPNQLVHTTYLNPLCSDDICCPYALPKLQNVSCDKGVPCNAYCGDYLS